MTESRQPHQKLVVRKPFIRKSALKASCIPYQRTRATPHEFTHLRRMRASSKPRSRHIDRCISFRKYALRKGGQDPGRDRLGTGDSAKGRLAGNWLGTEDGGATAFNAQRGLSRIG